MTGEDPEGPPMKERTKTRPKYKIVFRPGKTLTKVMLLVVIVLSTVTLIAIHGAIQHAEEKAQALRSQAFAEEQEQQELRQDIDALGSSDSVEKIAEEELGLVDPDTVVIVGDDQ